MDEETFSMEEDDESLSLLIIPTKNANHDIFYVGGSVGDFGNQVKPKIDIFAIFNPRVNTFSPRRFPRIYSTMLSTTLCLNE